MMMITSFCLFSLQENRVFMYNLFSQLNNESTLADRLRELVCASYFFSFLTFRDGFQNLPYGADFSLLNFCKSVDILMN